MVTTGECYPQCCAIESDRWEGASVMVWGGMSWDHKTLLVCIDDTLTAQRYIDNTLQPVVLPFLQQHDDVTAFQQDNARPHSACISMEYLNNVNASILNRSLTNRTFMGYYENIDR